MSYNDTFRESNANNAAVHTCAMMICVLTPFRTGRLNESQGACTLGYKSVEKWMLQYHLGSQMAPKDLDRLVRIMASEKHGGDAARLDESGSGDSDGDESDTGVSVHDLEYDDFVGVDSEDEV
jgi:hypothetical protein